MPFGIGPLELVIVLVIILVIFGPKRLPGLGRSLGQGMREFKDSVTSKSEQDAQPPELESPAGEPSPRAGADAEREPSKPRA